MGTSIVDSRLENTYNRSAVVAHTCNSDYLGGRDWEVSGLRPVRANCSQDPITTNGWVWWHTPVIPAKQGIINRRIVVTPNV
jgi:hypothetical protein